MIAKLKKNKLARQTLLLFSAQIIGIVIAFISSMLLAKKMGVELFGIYSLSVALISFLAIFFEFGYFTSCSRLLAITEDKAKEKEIIGASLLIILIIGFLFAFIVFIASFIANFIFEEQVGGILLLASVVSWSFILPFYMELILKGSNQIEILSIFNLSSKILFVLILFVLFSFKLLTPAYVLISLSISCIIPFLYFVYKLTPSLYLFKENLRLIQRENVKYGIHIYSGRVIDSASYKLDRLLIGFFVGAKDVGLYSLANSMANPINTFSNSLSSSSFKSFSNGLDIPIKVLKVNFLWIIASVIGANVFGYVIIHYYLSQVYQDVQLLLFFMSLAIAFQAAYQPYNAWLVVNGFKREIIIKTISTAVVNIVCNLLLIPLFGTIGAVLATLISMAVSFGLYRYFYIILKEKK